MLTKDQITQDALIKLRATGARVRKVHNVSAYKKRRGQVEKGWCDVGGFSSTAVHIECEIKTIGDRLSIEQKELLLQLERSGGIALVATEQRGETVIMKISEYLTSG